MAGGKKVQLAQCLGKKTAKTAGKGLRGRDFVSVDDCSAGEICNTGSRQCQPRCFGGLG